MKYFGRRIISAGLFIFVINAGANGQAIEKSSLPDRWLGRDKLAHFTVSLAAVGFTNHCLAFEGSQPSSRARNVAMGFTLSLGLIKEMADGSRQENHFSCKDLTADVLGVLCGLFLFTLK